MAFLHEGAPCGMRSLRSDTLTMRVTDVRITVFCSAIVIDVIVHCHTVGAFWVKRQKTIVPIIVWLGFYPFRPVQNHTRRMDTSSTTQMAQILGTHWRSCGTSRTKFLWTPIGRIVMGKTIRGSSVGTWMRTRSKLGMSVCSSKTILIGIRRIHKHGWKEAEYGSRVEKWMKNVDLDNFISWSCVFGMHSTRMQTDWNWYWGEHKDVWITGCRNTRL